MTEPVKRPVAEHPQVAGALEMIDAAIEARLAHSGVPSLSLGVVVDQDLIHARSFGFADVERGIAASPDTRYRIASISKTFTSMALLRLRDEGKLTLDDAVADHLPWFALPAHVDGDPAITVRHLITHTAGLPREAAELPYWTDGAFPSRAQLGERKSTVYSPDERFKYSNLGLALAGEIVASVAAEPWAAYVQRALLDPLGLAETRLEPEEGDAGLAVGYGRRSPQGARARSPFTHANALGPAAGMASTVRDLALWLSFQLGDGSAAGAQLVAPRTLREMHRVHRVEPDWRTGQGLGFGVRRIEGRTLVGHGGAVQGHRTGIEFWAEEKLGVVALTNADDGTPFEVIDLVFRLLGPAVAAARKPVPSAERDAAWERYVGLYTSTWGDTRVLFQGAELVLFAPLLPDPRESLLRLTPVEEHTFRIEGDAGLAPVGELARFELDAEGRVTRLRLGDTYHDRVG